MVPLNNLNRVNGGVAIVRCKGSVVIVSTNLTFPSSSVFNVSLIVPSVDCLVRGQSGMQTIIVARNRRSRVNNLSCLLGRMGIPMCTAGLMYNLVRKGLGRGRVAGCALGRIRRNSRMRVNYVGINFVRAGRSVPSTDTLCFHAPIKAVIRANSFGVSLAPISNQRVSVRGFTRLNHHNILLLVSSDAGTRQTNCARSRAAINRTFHGTFHTTGNHVVLTAFTSGVSHVRRTVGATIRFGHGIAILKQDVIGGIRVTVRLNCLSIPRKILVRPSRLGHCPSSRVLVLAANDRNRPVTNLSHVTSGGRHDIDVVPNSAIVVSTAPVPNGRANINHAVSGLVHLNTGIVTNQSGGVRMSNRTDRRRLGLVLRLVGPGCFVPIRNRCHVLGARNSLTIVVNITGSRILVNSGNRVFRFSGHSNRGANRIGTNHIFISNLNINSINGVIVHSHRRLTVRKIIVIIVALTGKADRPLTKPSVISHNFICIHSSRRLVHRTRSHITTILRHYRTNGVHR